MTSILVPGRRIQFYPPEYPEGRWMTALVENMEGDRVFLTMIDPPYVYGHNFLDAPISTLGEIRPYMENDRKRLQVTSFVEVKRVQDVPSKKKLSFIFFEESVLLRGFKQTMNLVKSNSFFLPSNLFNYPIKKTWPS
jgi:hypothetical protein